MAEQMRCDRCNQEFPNQDQLNRHNREQHDGAGQNQGQNQGQGQQQGGGGQYEQR